MKDLTKGLQERNREEFLGENTCPNDAWHTSIYDGKAIDLDTLTAQTVQATQEYDRDNLAETVRGYRIRVTPEERDTILSALDVQL